MKRLALLPVCAVLTVRAWRWPYWLPVLQTARSILRPEPCNEGDLIG